MGFNGHLSLNYLHTLSYTYPVVENIVFSKYGQIWLHPSTRVCLF